MASSSSRLPAARRPGGIGSSSRPISMFEVPTDHLKRLQQLGGDTRRNGSVESSLDSSSSTTSKQAKRRSLLPTFSSRKTSSEETEVFPAIREDTSDSEVSSRPVVRDDRKTMPPPPKPARTSSLRAPASTSFGKAAAPHARTISRDSNGSSSKPSNTTGSPQKVDSALRRTAVTRLPGASGQQAIPTRGSSARAVASTTTAQKRASVAVMKPPVLDTNVAPDSADQPSPPSPASSVASRQSVSTIANLVPRKHASSISRPAFSTYQQHYSPAKSAVPKPPVPTAKSSKHATTPSMESPTPINFETMMEQVELLQLSMLHQVSNQVMQGFEESARRKLAEKHAQLQKDFESIQVQEQERRRVRNLLSLESWCPDAALLAEHLQTLSRVVSDLRGHTESGSRYSDLTETFDQWLAKGESTLLGDHRGIVGVELLPESWRSTHTSLSLKLRSIQRDIGTLPPAPPSSDEGHFSSLEVILESCSELVESMLKELEIMTKLHKEVLQQGRDRIDEQINAVISDSTSGVVKESWVPAWQSVR